jgi:hypothetical protein
VKRTSPNYKTFNQEGQNQMTVTTKTSNKIVSAEDLNRCNRVEDCSTGTIFYMIESRTTPGVEHKVEAIFKNGAWHVVCSCPAGNPPVNAYGVPLYAPKDCWHKQAAAAHAAEYKAAIKAAAQARAKKDERKPIANTVPAWMLTGPVAHHMSKSPKARH